ncbi:MAG: hypothetical protein IJO62_03165 [Clostridia bacterium]|nr:hypothetical protein [Clostridia bacterium]
MIEKIKSFSFKKLLYSKRFTIPFSIFLSFALWMTITVQSKDHIQRSFADMTATINMENTLAAENEMSIIGDISEQRFTVTVIGQKNVVTTLTSSDINLYASAATVDSPGEYDLTVLANSANSNGNYDVISITPKTVKVKFDYMETREFTVNALADGVSASNGLIAEAAVVSGMEGNTITITGPRAVINSIETVRAEAAVNKTLSQSETFDASIVLLDEDGEKISAENLQLSTNQVKITVPISKQKTVPVKVDFSNTPNGFNKGSIKSTVDHSEVTIIGTPETVDKIKEVTLSPIDITALSSASTSFEVSAKLPEGVRLLDAIESFTVNVNLSGYREKTITVTKIKYTGLAQGLQTSGSTSVKNVKICGPANVIRNLDESAAFAEVNLTDKKAGQHAVNAVISFEGYDNVWAVGTYETPVTIK